MSDIVADAKAWLETRDNQTLRTHSEHCHRVHVDCLVSRLVAEVQRHRMTPDEREAAGDAAAECDYDNRGMAIQGYLDRTEPEEAGRE